MTIFEYFYENPPNNRHYLPRKVEITKSNTLLYGAAQSGKTSLAIDYAINSESKFLYLDLSDVRIKNIDSHQLTKFIQNEKIDILIIDNFDNSFQIPTNTKQNILISQNKFLYENYSLLKLYYFDFEEFLNTTQKSTTQSFNLYLKNGAFDNTAQMIAKAWLDQNKLYLFCVLCEMCAKTVSINQIYLNLKKEIKISKDWLYSAIDWFTQHHYIYFLDKINAPKSQKKLFISHQPFVNSLTLGTTFIAIFQNLIVNELIKKGLHPTYYELSSYLIGKKLIKVEPFASEEAIWVKIQKNFGEYKKLGITSIAIVTVSSSFEFMIENVKCEAMPFYEWAVLDEF